MYPTVEEMREVSAQFNELKRKEDWDGAIKVLLKYLENYPNEYWTYTMLAALYLTKDEFPIALEYATKAYAIYKKDPMVIYHYADALIYNNQAQKGIILMKKILNMDINEIAYGIGGEGIRYARRLTNDSRAMIGIGYMKLGNKKKAIEWFNSHLEHRQKGSVGAYRKRWIEKKIKEIESWQ